MPSAKWDTEAFEADITPYEGRAVGSPYELPTGKDLTNLKEVLAQHENGIVLGDAASVMVFGRKDLPKARSVVVAVRKKFNAVGIGIGMSGKERIRLKLLEK